MHFRHWFLTTLVAGLLATSCAGAAFSGDDDGMGGQGGSGPQSGGASGSIGTSDNVGGGGAGSSGEAGAAGASTGSDCRALGGLEFEDHCYVDATEKSVTEPEAVATCSQLAKQSQRTAHLLVLDSSAEQAFILEQFLVAYTDMSDAWLALTCHELVQPDINACYCTGCSAAELLEKQRAWQWLDGSSATFGWVNANPNEGFRCAALGYNPATTIWGWVDRACDKSVFMPTDRVPHDYRTICEFEP